MDSRGSALRAGFARVDITPPLAAAYLSFDPRQTRFAGLHDRLHARAAVFDNGHTALAVVSADALGLSRSVLGAERDFIAEVRAGVAAQTGLAPDHVLVAATHAHSTPQTTDIHDLLGWFPDLAGWVEQLRDQLVEAVVSAWRHREPGALHGGTGEAPGIAWSRRILTRDGRLVQHGSRPEAAQVVRETRDDRVPVLLWRGATRCGALFGFCCHATTVQANPLVSADYPGVACDFIERSLELDAALFLQGACGDVNPIRGTTDFDDVQLYGRSLGEEVTRLAAVLDARDHAAMSDTLAAATRCVEVPRRALPDAAALGEEVARCRAILDGDADEAAKAAARAAHRPAFEALRLCQLGQGPVPIEVQVLRLGEALLIAVEGELFCEFGRRLIAGSPAPLTVVVGYANGYQGYLPLPETYAEGGYEPRLGAWTRVSEQGGELVCQQAATLAQEVWASAAAGR